MRIFWKELKIASASGALSSIPRLLPAAALPDPRDFTPTYYYNFVEFVSSIKCVSLPSTLKKEHITSVNVLLLLHPHFCTYFFTLNSVVFVDVGRKNISCSRAQGTLATPLNICTQFLLYVQRKNDFMLFLIPHEEDDKRLMIKPHTKKSWLVPKPMVEFSFYFIAMFVIVL